MSFLFAFVNRSPVDFFFFAPLTFSIPLCVPLISVSCLNLWLEFEGLVE